MGIAGLMAGIMVMARDGLDIVILTGRVMARICMITMVTPMEGTERRITIPIPVAISMRTGPIDSFTIWDTENSI